MSRIVLAVFLFHALLVSAQDGPCGWNGTYDPAGGTCDCDDGWIGANCTTLDVRPASPGTGFAPVQTDAWGAAVLKDEATGLYHMWVSVIDAHCDIEYWARNSKVVHATSSTPQGPYTAVGDAFPVMAHAVDVKRGPGGNWVAFLTAGVTAGGALGPSSYGAPCNCDPGTQQPIGGCFSENSEEATVVCTASSPYGPWSNPVVLLDPTALLDGIDANFSAAVAEDGSLVGLWRTYPSGSQMHWVTATNYLDPATYSWQEQETPLFSPPHDGLTSEGVEDPFVWYDAGRGAWHVLLHDMTALGGADFYDGLAHAWTTDGVNWTWTGEAATSSASFTDGSSSYSARARPHLILEGGRITHLISAEQFDANDWSYALIEPVGEPLPDPTDSDCPDPVVMALACGPGTVWSPADCRCLVAYPADADFDSCITVADILLLLGQFGQCQ